MISSTASQRRRRLSTSIAATAGSLGLTLGMLVSAGAATAAPTLPNAADRTVADVSEDTPLPALDGAAGRNETQNGRSAVESDSGDAVTNLSGCAPLNFTDNRTGSAYYDAIRWMQCAGMTAGQGDNSFGKDQDITRAQVTAFLFGMEAPGDYEGPATDVFEDVTPGSSYFRAISWAAQSDVVDGYADGTFKKGRSLTRAHLAKMLYRMSGETHEASGPVFADVGAGSQYAEAVGWLKAEGITAGYADGTFKPGQTITRAETGQFLYQYAKVTGQNVNAPVGQNRDLTQTQWAAAAKQNIIEYCGTGVDVEAQPDWGNRGGFEARKDVTTGEIIPGSVREYIELQSNLFGQSEQTDPDHPAAVHIQYHECAHVLQFRNYGYDGPTARAAMDALYPQDGDNTFIDATRPDGTPYGWVNGLEHMADCMADAMGGLRYGDDTTQYISGYGGDCTPAQMDWAERLVAGERIEP